MSTVKAGDVVEIHFEGKLADGTVFTSSKGYEPITAEVGSKDLFDPINQAIVGMSVGDRKSVTVEPKDAYGEVNDELIVKVPKSQLPSDLEEGQVFSSEEEPDMEWTVEEIEGDFAVLNGNHPLAGHKLTFSIELKAITKSAPLLN